MADWNDDRVGLLKKLWAEGLASSQIAEKLGGVTRNEVIGKVHRLGLTGRAKTSNNAASIRVAPGHFILSTSEFVCSKKIHERVFLQAVLDMREEYFESLAAGRREKAAWIIARSYIALVGTVMLQLVSSAFAKLAKTLWS